MHPAVRAAGIFVTASPAADTANESSTGTDHQNLTTTTYDTRRLSEWSMDSQIPR